MGTQRRYRDQPGLEEEAGSCKVGPLLACCRSVSGALTTTYFYAPGRDSIVGAVDLVGGGQSARIALFVAHLLAVDLWLWPTLAFIQAWGRVSQHGLADSNGRRRRHIRL